MLSKKPVHVLKKKLYPDLIMYKIAWSNGSITYDPMTQLTPEMLEIV